jgi:NCS1 family nucleobase:cation symporter-1
MTVATPTTEAPARGGIELNGINTISESERKGKASSLFWPWFAANVSVLGIPYGAYLLSFHVSFWQGLIVGIIGIVISFGLCGIVAIAGKRGSAPTMVLSRAAFGVNGNRIPSVLSWILTVGWETVLTSLAVLATSTVFTDLGWDGGTVTKVVALIIVSALIIAGGVFGFNAIMRIQTWITVISAILTVIFFILVLGHIDFTTVFAIKGGSVQDVIGGLVFMMTGFGLGWVNAAADYSRYLPRSTRTGGVVGWTTFGSAIAPIILFVFGLLLAGSSDKLVAAIYVDPIGALASILPVWFLIPFIVVAILGLVGGAVLDIYSSGLALLTAGIRIPRFAAAGIDGVIMILGSIYVVFIASNFFFPFQGFLITLGVPVAAWCGIFVADLLARRKDYSERDLYTSKGRYGSFRLSAIILFVVGTIVGWGFVTNTYAPWLAWQGYLFGPESTKAVINGFRDSWGTANLGVLFALVIGFVGTLIFGRGAVRRQEALPVDHTLPAEAPVGVPQP